MSSTAFTVPTVRSMLLKLRLVYDSNPIAPTINQPAGLGLALLHMSGNVQLAHDCSLRR
jgi:hypothetical protein